MLRKLNNLINYYVFLVMGKINRKSISTPLEIKKSLEKISKNKIKDVVPPLKQIKAPLAPATASTVNFFGLNLVASDSKNESQIKVKTASSKILKRTIKKKDKIKLKKEQVLKNIELTQDAFKEDKLRKKREKTVITGDMKSLLDSLPELDSLFTLSRHSKKTGVPEFDQQTQSKTKKQIKKAGITKKTKEYRDRTNHFKKVLNSEKFQKNPRKLIAEQIKKRRQEQQTNK